MRIDSIKIRNFRCFPEKDGGSWGVQFRPNPHLSLLVGPNGAGKTAILDALDLVLNAENRSNQSLITEYDFTNCDTSKPIYIEVSLVDLGEIRGEFVSDIQWIDPADGLLVEEKGIPPETNCHREAIVVALEAFLDERSGAIEWRWLLPKFPATSIESAKELSRSQHQALGYFRLRPTISAGTFTFGHYSVLGRHLKKLQYRLGKLPKRLRGQSVLPTCTLFDPQCSDCPSRSDCIPVREDEVPSSSQNSLPTIGAVLNEIVTSARKMLNSSEWTEMQPGLGPRYGGLSSALAALTVGLRHNSALNQAFIPFDRLSAGEKYALSFALAKAQIPGERPPVIIMEEPETALYPSAISALLRDVQSIPSGKEPQVIVSSHSEAVLRCFIPDDIFIIEKGHSPQKLMDAVRNINPSKGHFQKPEYLIMPGGPSVLFADKVLVMEGARDIIISGHLDRIAAKYAAVSACPHISFAMKGWCVFHAFGADQIMDCIRMFQTLGKKTAAVFDGDDTGRKYAEEVKDICPTFVYRSCNYKQPALEEALLAGLPTDDAKQILTEFDNCPACPLGAPRRACWTMGGKCPKGSKDDRKNLLQNLCLEAYEKQNLFPSAFKNLLQQIDSAVPGKVYELNADQ